LTGISHIKRLATKPNFLIAALYQNLTRIAFFGDFSPNCLKINDYQPFARLQRYIVSQQCHDVKPQQ
jgi:3-methyladenine DNA glycosylase/8-oxoguanine DNA glycosylase